MPLNFKLNNFLKEVRNLLGVMNQEVEDRFMPEGDYRSLYNGDNGNIKDAGAAKNNLGNILINNPYLTSGENKVIGSFEDMDSDSIIYCVYNELGYHGIYRWFRNKSPYINGVIEKIYQVKDPLVYDKFNENPLSFSKEQFYNITGITLVGDLFQFTDNKVRSKTIDLVRANETEKRRRFKFIINKNNCQVPGYPVNCTLKLYEPLNPTPVYILTWVSIGETIKDRISEFNQAYLLSPSPDFSVHVCDDHCQIEMVKTGEYFIELSEVEVGGFPALTTPDLVIADNFYPDFCNNVPLVSGNDNARVDFFDRGRYTPLLPPTCTYKTDLSYELNLVSKSVFQFRVRYQYFDNSWSVYGAISKVSIPSSTGIDNLGLQDNYIEINFSDPRLTSPTLCTVIKSVEIAMNEPAIDNLWKTVKNLEQQEVVGINQATYNFYNNGAYTTIAPALTTKQFDSLPIVHKSEEFADGRSFLGNITEGYDIPCLEMQTSVAYKENPIVRGHSIRGRLYIVNTWTGINQFIFRKHYGSLSSSDAIFGGVFQTYYNAPQNFKQYAPRLGWTVYLAGTDNYCVTKQMATGLSTQATDGVFDVNNDNDLGDIQRYANLTGIIYQEFEIKNVTDGEYVLRISGHCDLQTCNSSNWFDNRNYQKTSTNVRNVGGSTNCEVHVTVNGSDVTISDTIIEDMTADGFPLFGVQGYITANDLATVPVTRDVLWNDTKIELAEVSIVMGANSKTVNTDHNGYFFKSIESPVLGATIAVYGLQSGLYGITFPAGYTQQFDLFNTSATWNPNAFPNTPNSEIGIFRVISTDIQNYSRTQIKGVFTGQQKYGVSIVQHLGGVVQTDINGNFSIYTYAAVFSNNRSLVLNFASSSLASVMTFPINNYILPPINIGNAPLYYNLANPFILSQLFTNIVVATSISATSFKNGSSLGWGIVYMDNLDRKCAVVLSDDSFTSIPFINTSNQVVDYVEFSIYSEPPDWATKYHIVRTKNLAENIFLQWAANKVEYVEEDMTTTTTLANATFLKIDIQNIGYYTTNLHPNSTLFYSFNKGDVLIMKANSAGVPFATNLQYEVVAVVGTDIFIYKDNSIDFTLPSANGLQFEIFTPRNKNQTNLYYEIGECYPIDTGVFGGVKKRFHKGSIQDQSYSLLPLYTIVPAVTRVFDGGTYRRLREIPVGVVAGTNGAPLISMVVDDESVSDFYISKADGTGRVNVNDPSLGQVVRKTAIRFSNEYKDGTQINGIHTFDALNDKQLNNNYGAINKLKLVDNTIVKAICDNSYMVSLYIKQSVIKSVNGALLYTLSDEEISNTNQMQRSFGTQHPESVVLNNEGDLFGWDEKQGVAWRSSGNGLIPVSDYKMRTTFNEIAQRRRNLGSSNSSCPAVYDIGKDLYIQTFCAKERSRSVLATGYLEFRDFNTELPTSAAYPNIKITIQPLNFVIFNEVVGTNPLYPNINQIVVNGINNANNGYTASLTNTGIVKIEKDVSMLGINYLSLLVEINWLTATAVPIPTGYSYNSLMTIAHEPPSPEIPSYEGETIAFSKEKKGWVQYYPFVPEFYEKLRSEYVSFVGGELYLHGKGQVGVFYGVFYPMVLRIVFNKDYRKVKKWKELGVNINDKNILCPEITTPPRENVPIGMNTELTKNHFKMKHGKYYASITRDKNTPNFPTIDEAWVNGRPMEGQSMTVNLNIDSSSEVKLTDIESIYIDSELS